MTTHQASTALGLDFGTSTSLIASRTADSPARVLPLGAATRYLPSVVGVQQNDSLSVGEEAENLPLGSAIRSVKTSITRRQTSVTAMRRDGAEVQLDVDRLVIALLSEAVARGSRSTRDGRADPGTHPLRLGCPALWESDQRARLTSLATRAGITVDGPCAANFRNPRPFSRMAIAEVQGPMRNAARLRPCLRPFIAVP